MSHSESQKSTSVFHALGSYADRIKEPNSSKPSRLERSQTSPTKNTMASARDVVEDDGEGSWETVRVGRNKARPERLDEKRGSSSRNWREREEKSDAVKEDKEASAPSQPAKSDFPPVSSVASRPKSADPAPATATPSASATPRSAWGATLPASSASAPPTATVNGTAAPQPVDAVSSSPQKQAPRKSSADAEAEGSWRARPNVSAPEVVASSAPPKAALPPAVNAWSLRKPVVPAAAVSTPTPAQAASAAPSAKAVESSPAAHANGEASASKKTKKKAEPPSVADSTLWPDVNQATKADDAKAKHEKNGAESADETAHGVSTGKKQKWKAIPATELQEAADKVAETSRRQAKQKQKQAKGETDSVDSKRSQGKKQSSESKKAPRMQRSASQGSLRSHGEGQRPNGANGDVGANGSAHSRQGAQGGSKRSSPSHSHMPLSPDQGVREVSSTGTLPQQGFNPASNLPRPPRGRDRDGRGGYAPRGRGSYRAASTAAMHRMYGGDLSPLGANASLYPAAYGVGYGGFYPVPAPSYVLAPGFDASQGTYNGVPVFPRGMPPPPMPVTQVANIDPQRFYVLGQVEYYFSMQNLAMDFFLRQQMDAEGWIDVGMIASFNRVKSLTPDAALVREVMVLSSLLEVNGDKVRLAGGEAKRWVLPDAKPSGPANLSPKKGTEASEISHGIPVGVGQDNVSALGMEDMGIPSMPTSPVPKFDVENALMKSSGSANVSSTASVLASEEGKTATPATSVTDEKSDDEEDK